MLTPLLLSQPEMAWIQCGNCDTYFVQQNAYFTKSACPRCERHSKLYGYVWPKTDKEGLNDEERVLDHRTVHRFYNLSDEMRVRGRKGADTPKEETPTEVKAKSKTPVKKTPKKAVVEEEVEEDPNLRRSGRARKASRRFSEPGSS